MSLTTRYIGPNFNVRVPTDSLLPVPLPALLRRMRLHGRLLRLIYDYVVEKERVTTRNHAHVDLLWRQRLHSLRKKACERSFAREGSLTPGGHG